MSVNVSLPRPPDKYDPQSEAQRNQLIEQAFKRAGGAAATPTPAPELVAWTPVTAGQALAANAPPVLAVLSSTQDFPLPAAPDAGDVFVLGNARGSTSGALARVTTGASQQIVGAPVGDDLTLEPGETVYLVARSATLLEVV